MITAPDLAQFNDEQVELQARRDFMIRQGYRFCDIAACNCGSWHGGHADNRLRQMHDTGARQLRTTRSALQCMKATQTTNAASSPSERNLLITWRAGTRREKQNDCYMRFQDDGY